MAGRQDQDQSRGMRRLLDLSRLFPGPYCARIFADWGFDVVKVEPPGGGDWARYVPPLNPETGQGLLFESLNRGKKSLSLNLKSEQGRDILLQLVEAADVFLESFRPGVRARPQRSLFRGTRPRCGACRGPPRLPSGTAPRASPPR